MSFARRAAIGTAVVASTWFAAAAAMAQDAPVGTANMTKVGKADGFCARRDEGICAEWRFTRAPQLRLVADGDEDGMEYVFYRRDPLGRYSYLLRVYPAMRDAARPGQLFWGYTWDITDIVLESGEGPVRVQASFSHAVEDFGPIENQPWQKQVPVVLFVGTATQPDMTVEAQDFQVSALPDLINEARRSPRETKP